MKTSCIHCGTPIPVRTLQGTKIQIEGECPNEWCPNPENVAKKNRETWGTIGSVIGLVILGLGIVGWYFILEGIEQGMGEDCRDRGGEWAPVRGVIGLPTGTGTCVGGDDG